MRSAQAFATYSDPLVLSELPIVITRPALIDEQKQNKVQSCAAFHHLCKLPHGAGLKFACHNQALGVCRDQVCRVRRSFQFVWLCICAGSAKLTLSTKRTFNVMTCQLAFVLESARLRQPYSVCRPRSPAQEPLAKEVEPPVAPAKFLNLQRLKQFAGHRVGARNRKQPGSECRALQAGAACPASPGGMESVNTPYTGAWQLTLSG